MLFWLVGDARIYFVSIFGVAKYKRNSPEEQEPFYVKEGRLMGNFSLTKGFVLFKNIIENLFSKRSLKYFRLSMKGASRHSWIVACSLCMKSAHSSNLLAPSDLTLIKVVTKHLQYLKSKCSSYIFNIEQATRSLGEIIK